MTSLCFFFPLQVMQATAMAPQPGQAASAAQAQQVQQAQGAVAPQAAAQPQTQQAAQAQAQPQTQQPPMMLQVDGAGDTSSEEDEDEEEEYDEDDEEEKDKDGGEDGQVEEVSVGGNERQSRLAGTWKCSELLGCISSSGAAEQWG